jgi:hypothetical protein
VIQAGDGTSLRCRPGQIAFRGVSEFLSRTALDARKLGTSPTNAFEEITAPPAPASPGCVLPNRTREELRLMPVVPFRPSAAPRANVTAPSTS